MKFALNKRGRLILACSVVVSSATVAWTQLSDNGPEVEWKDEVQAGAPAPSAIPTAEEVLAEMNREAGRNKFTTHFNLIASEDTAARQRDSQEDPLSVLTEEDTQDTVSSALSQQSSIKISAVVAGSGQFSPNPAPQYHSASARDSLSGGGVGGAKPSSPNDPQKEIIDPPKPSEEPVDCKKTGPKNGATGEHQDEKCHGDDQTPPPNPGPGEEPGGEPGDPVSPGGQGGQDGNGEKPKPTVSVDEPGTLALFSLGLVGLAAFSRRKKKLD